MALSSKSEVAARSAGRVGIGVSVGLPGSPWVGGRSGFCPPVYPVSRWGGVSVMVPLQGLGGWYDPWDAPPVCGWDLYPAPHHGSSSYPPYFSPYCPPSMPREGMRLPGSKAGFSGSQQFPPQSKASPGPSFTPPPYTPLERSLEKSPGASNQAAAPSRATAVFPATRSALSNLGYPTGPTPTGHPRVYRIQKALKQLGYYEADVDGQMGRATQTAIRTYQIDRGFPVTGRIDPALEKNLGLSSEL